MLEHLAQRITSEWNRTRTVDIEQIAIEFDEIVGPDRVGLALSRLGDLVAKQCPEAARSIYLEAVNHLLVVTQDTFGLLVAALCNEKAKEFDLADKLYERLHGKLQGDHWKAAVEAMKMRCLAKRSMSSGCISLARYYFAKAADSFSAAVQRADDPPWQKKWFASVEEMRFQSQKCEEQVATPMIERSRPSSALHANWRVWGEPVYIGPFQSMIFEHQYPPRNQRDVLITGGMHGNETAGPLAASEIMDALTADVTVPIRIWPCMDTLGYFAAPQLAKILGEPLPRPWPDNTVRFEKVPQLSTILAQPGPEAGASWLREIAEALRVLGDKAEGAYQYFLWQDRGSPKDGGPPLCRTFMISAKGLRSLSDLHMTSPLAPLLRSALDEEPELWLDLHEARGSGFHIYISPNSRPRIWDIAHAAVQAVSNIGVMINETIWNRTALSPGIFAVPGNARITSFDGRIVFECGEDLPIWTRVGVLVTGILAAIKALRADL